MRIDKLIVVKFNISREKAQQLIKNGCVYVDQKQVLKTSYNVEEGSQIEVTAQEQYVSRGAYKLLGAISCFNLNFNDKIVLDIGASTGGFSQVCLLNGAKKVYSLDIGKNELDKNLKNDFRIVDYSGLDFRNAKKENFIDVNFIVGDLSFISLKHILPKIIELFGNKIEVCMLFKPQFECGKILARKYKGVVLDRKIHITLLQDFVLYLQKLGFNISGIDYSRIRGKSGNIEYLFHLNGDNYKSYNITKIVEEAFLSL